MIDFNAILAALQNHQYLTLLLPLALYLRTVSSSKSSFTWPDVPVNLLPIFSAVAGASVALIGTLEANDSWQVDLATTGAAFISAGGADALAVGFFGSTANVPSYIKFILGIVDSASPPAPTATNPPTPPANGTAPPPAS